MGSKREAKHLATDAGVPLVPGYAGDDSADARLLAAAACIGYPVMLKASAGGGGKGMRVVARAGDLPDALAAAPTRGARSLRRRDATAGESADRAAPHRDPDLRRHSRQCDHLGERECSIQRRHQKVIEETPSPR